MNILILSALTEELVPIRNCLIPVFRDDPDIHLFFRKIPVGLEYLKLELQTLKDEISFDIIINAGTAGAISEILQPLDIFFPLILAAEQKQPLRQTLCTGKQERQTVSIPDQWKTGPLFTSNKPVLSVKRKQEIERSYHALAVDMEAYPIAAACTGESVPFLVLKVISDTADSNTMTIFKQNLKRAVEILSRQLVELINILKEVGGAL